jgi:hypothetical protein
LLGTGETAGALAGVTGGRGGASACGVPADGVTIDDGSAVADAVGVALIALVAVRADSVGLGVGALEMVALAVSEGAIVAVAVSEGAS